MSRKIMIAGLTAGLLVLWCDGIHAIEPSNSYWFLDLPSSSHVVALGGGGSALVDADIMLVESNPALLGSEIGRQMSVGYVNWLGSTNLVTARYGQSAGVRGAWGAGIKWLDHGSFEGYDEEGMATGSFRATDFVIEGIYSHDFTDRLRGGINVKTIVSSYEIYTAVALGVDLGLNWYDEECDMSASLVVRNLGGQLKRFENHHERLPIDLSLGWMKGLGDSGFAVNVQASHLTDWKDRGYGVSDGLSEEKRFSAGEQIMRHLTFGLQYEPVSQFYAAVGYNYRTRSDMAGYGRSVLSGLSVGTGLNLRNFMIGVAVSQPHKGALGVTLNLGLDFNSLLD